MADGDDPGTLHPELRSETRRVAPTDAVVQFEGGAAAGDVAGPSLVRAVA